MRNLYLFVLACVIASFISSCSKEKSQEGESVISPTPCAYAPYTPGSTFNYENISNTDTINYTLKVGGDTTINGKTYKTVGNDSVFICSGCKDGIYTQVANLLTFQGYQADDLELTYLKDNVSAGASWQDTITVSNGSISTTGVLEYTVTEKDVSKTVNGQEFEHVIAVRMDAFAVILNNPVPVGTISTSYYSKGVGLIEADQEQDTTRIVSYTIAP
ncbi:hypothetical protein DVR12_10020 [Chitinophaga silvatica]|uniref:Uncharacterized protein n=1 Tax=Chitinophaga silvatica TaxID=2282649 RepID=A0A3E1YC14_9BACT|nr:hypothetical protein [Chitinophaga silvatica]RFS23344.1 hypothetical protein DVR12_10020 [Chitinophaga silvatica]